MNIDNFHWNSPFWGGIPLDGSKLLENGSTDYRLVGPFPGSTQGCPAFHEELTQVIDAFAPAVAAGTPAPKVIMPGVAFDQDFLSRGQQLLGQLTAGGELQLQKPAHDVEAQVRPVRAEHDLPAELLGLSRRHRGFGELRPLRLVPALARLVRMFHRRKDQAFLILDLHGPEVTEEPVLIVEVGNHSFSFISENFSGAKALKKTSRSRWAARIWS
jgi:hypothetical protein